MVCCLLLEQEGVPFCECHEVIRTLVVQVDIVL